MKKYFFLVMTVLCLSANVYSQSWNKLIAGQFNHQGSDDSWFWYEFTYAKDGKVNLIYYVDKTHDTLKYSETADSETMMYCNAVLDSILFGDDRSNRPPMGMRGTHGRGGAKGRISTSLQYTDETGSVKKEYFKTFRVINVLEKLNFRYYLNLAAKKHKELVE